MAVSDSVCHTVQRAGDVTQKSATAARLKSVIKPSPRLEAKTTSLSASAAVHCARSRIHPHHMPAYSAAQLFHKQARTTDTHSVFVSVRRPTLLPQPRSRAS